MYFFCVTDLLSKASPTHMQSSPKAHCLHQTEINAHLHCWMFEITAITYSHNLCVHCSVAPKHFSQLPHVLLQTISNKAQAGGCIGRVIVVAL